MCHINLETNCYVLIFSLLSMNVFQDTMANIFAIKNTYASNLIRMISFTFTKNIVERAIANIIMYLI